MCSSPGLEVRRLKIFMQLVTLGKYNMKEMQERNYLRYTDVLMKIILVLLQGQKKKKKNDMGSLSMKVGIILAQLWKARISRYLSRAQNLLLKCVRIQFTIVY